MTSAATLYRAALDIDRQALGNDHPQVGMHLQNLAVTLHAQGKLEEAAPLYEESMQILRRVLGEQHPQTLDASANYGRFLHRRGELARAAEVLGKVVELDRQARGARPRFRRSRSRQSRQWCGWTRSEQAQAEKEFRAALDIYAQTLPADHPYVASALSGLGRCTPGAESSRAKPSRRCGDAKEIGSEIRSRPTVRSSRPRTAPWVAC